MSNWRKASCSPRASSATATTSPASSTAEGAGEDGVNTYNVLDVTLAPRCPDARRRRHPQLLHDLVVRGVRQGFLDAVRTVSRHSPGDDPTVVAAETLSAMPDQLRSAQKVFASTGGLHGAALFDADGTMLVVREDIGRHNAVDKVIGWALENRPDTVAGTVLLVSGRASFELTQKAVMAGIPILAAVSAPSSLAVDLASQAGLTLVAFLRGESMNVYTRPDRVTHYRSNPQSPPDLHTTSKLRTPAPIEPVIVRMTREITRSPACPPVGHVAPLLNVARGLVDPRRRRHLPDLAHGTPTRSAPPAHAAPAAARRRLRRLVVRRRPARPRRDVRHRADQLRRQARLRASAAASGRRASGAAGGQPSIDAILDRRVLPRHPADAARRHAASRPPILTYSTTPLFLTSRDTAPGGTGIRPDAGCPGPPAQPPAQRGGPERAAAARAPCRRTMLDALGLPTLPVFVLDSAVLADRLIVPTIPEFEYHRSDLPDHVRFVGAVSPSPPTDFVAAAVVG